MQRMFIALFVAGTLLVARAAAGSDASDAMPAPPKPITVDQSEILEA